MAFLSFCGLVSSCITTYVQRNYLHFGFFNFFDFFFNFLPGSNSLFTNYSESTRLKMSSLPVGELTASCLIVEEVKITRR